MSTTDKTTLAILVPQVEELVRPFRHRYSPSGGLGMPGHITVLHPFKPAGHINDSVEERLKKVIAFHARFDFSFTATGRFPEVLYLKPTPIEPFKRLTEALAAHFPETPPYEGKIADPTPHLTVAKLDDAALLERVAVKFSDAIGGHMPICATATQVCLMAKEAGRWHRRTAFNLG